MTYCEAVVAMIDDPDYGALVLDNEHRMDAVRAIVADDYAQEFHPQAWEILRCAIEVSEQRHREGYYEHAWTFTHRKMMIPPLPPKSAWRLIRPMAYLTLGEAAVELAELKDGGNFTDPMEGTKLVEMWERDFARKQPSLHLEALAHEAVLDTVQAFTRWTIRKGFGKADQANRLLAWIDDFNDTEGTK